MYESHNVSLCNLTLSKVHPLHSTMTLLEENKEQIKDMLEETTYPVTMQDCITV